MARINIGTAGWTVPRDVSGRFPTEGSALERYATRFRVVEINSSFHRPHRRSTWERWRNSVPPAFRFSAKLPKVITHQRKLVDCADELGEFFGQVTALGEKLGVVLVQLPPKLELDQAVAGAFLRDLGARTSANVACEPRHPSWFTAEAGTLLEQLNVALVAADPAICDAAGRPGGWRGLSYWRLHGSPIIYRSSYRDRIAACAALLDDDAASGAPVWCIFDNTASSAAVGDALALVAATGA